MVIANQKRCIAIALIVMNTLAVATCIANGVYQYYGDRLGSLSTSGNVLYNKGRVEIYSCASSNRYAQTKYLYLYVQLAFANVGLVLALVCNLAAVFFSVGLFGTTKEPRWKYCAIPIIKIKIVLYCMFAIATLLTGAFAGFVVQPFFYISSFVCHSPSSVLFQMGLLIQVILAGVNFIVCLVCLILTLIIKIQKTVGQKFVKGRISKEMTEMKQLMILDDKEGFSPINLSRARNKDGVYNPNNIGEQILEFSLVQNPMQKQDPRQNITMNYQNLQMSDLHEEMLQKQQIDQEPGPLIIEPDPFSFIYQGGSKDIGFLPKKPHRYRLETGTTNRVITNYPAATEKQKNSQINPFMAFIPQKIFLLEKKTLEQPSQTSPVKNTKQETVLKRKMKAHPKLQSSMKSQKYVDDMKHTTPSVLSYTGPPHLFNATINQEPSIRQQNQMKPNQRLQAVDMTMTLVNELNKMNFMQANPVNNTQGVIPEYQNNFELGNEQSMNINVSKVLPEGQNTNRHLGLTPQ